MGSSNHGTTTIQDNNVSTENNVEQHVKDSKTYNYDMSDFNVNHGNKVMGGETNIRGIDNAGTQYFRLMNLEELK